MSERVKFFLDEQVDFAVARALRRREMDVITAQEANQRATDDVMVLRAATRQTQVFANQDADALRLAAQVSEVADKLAASCLAPGEGQPDPTLPAYDRQTALLWLGATAHAWEAVVECHPAGSPAYQADWQKRQRFQQALLALLRQAG